MTILSSYYRKHRLHTFHYFFQLLLQWNHDKTCWLSCLTSLTVTRVMVRSKELLATWAVPLFMRLSFRENANENFFSWLTDFGHCAAWERRAAIRWSSSPNALVVRLCLTASWKMSKKLWKIVIWEPLWRGGLDARSSSELNTDSVCCSSSGSGVPSDSLGSWLMDSFTSSKYSRSESLDTVDS